MEYKNCLYKLKEQTEINKERLNEINKLQSELNMHKMEIANLRLQLMNYTESEYESDEIKKLKIENELLKKYKENTILSISTCRNYIMKLENEKLHAKKQMIDFTRMVLSDTSNKFAGITESINNCINHINNITSNYFNVLAKTTTVKFLKELSTPRDLRIENKRLIEEQKKLLEQEAKSSEIITELKIQYQKQIYNVKKSIQECRRLQCELTKSNKERENLVDIINKLKRKK